MKKFLNKPTDVVGEMLEGIVAAHPSLRRVPGFNVIARADAPVAGKVGLISGGGSGHEPAHAGYVGKGMLTAAVAGAVFTSPSPDQILAAIQAADGGQGVLMVVKNYTGDCMNFEMAGEMAQDLGIETARVLVNDDVAVENSTWTAGRRGVAGTVFVHKLAGAAADLGLSLAEVVRVGEKVVANVRSKGVALDPCLVPGALKPNFTLAADEMELGIGIHGEPGTKRVSLMSADAVATDLVESILADMPVNRGERVALMLNGLGATPMMELYILYRKAAAMLTERGIQVHRGFVGEYMTALEMTGASVTILKLDEELGKLLDHPASAPGWSGGAI